ncbi:MAG TPA: NAD(P)/FAD-dependent oxidoreductase [Solirubrobacterales bacterium]
MAEPLPSHVDVAIVGAGFGGLGMAIKLREAGREDFVVIERAEDVGGTWEANTYPGCQCDVPSNLYSFSFAPNPDWSHTFAMQEEIWDYLRRVADDHGLRPKIRCGCELTGAEWDEDAGRWRVETSQGTLTARLLVSAVGGLCEPSIPELPGIEDFEGTAFHTSRWDHAHDLRGRRVAVVGTGASALQVIPRIQPEVEQLTVFQRTPAWVMPHPGRRTRPRERWLFRHIPALQRLLRGAIYWGRELYILPFRHRLLRRAPERMALRHLEEQVPDPELRAKLTPEYEVGCKRILFSDEYYPALQQPNVELVTGGVAEVRPHGLVGADGREHEVDTIIWGTGFKTKDLPIAEQVRGRGGRLLKEVWRDSGMQALRGTTMAGFPNYFMLLGPNTGLGHNSIVFIIESQLAYVMDALSKMDARGAAIFDTRQEAQDAFNRRVQAESEGTVWTEGGCSSWYVDEHGRNPVLWPHTSWTFRQATRCFDPAEYALEPARSMPRQGPVRSAGPKPARKRAPARQP